MRRVQIRDSRINNVYIKRVRHLVFPFYSLNKTHNSTYSLIKFLLDFLTGYRVWKMLTHICAIPANTLIFESDFGI